jgi:hypothetical protein
MEFYTAQYIIRKTSKNWRQSFNIIIIQNRIKKQKQILYNGCDKVRAGITNIKKK